MSKKTYLVIQSNGCRHVVSDADGFCAERGEVAFSESGVRIAYFSGVSAVVVQGEKPEPPLAHEPGEPLSVLGSVADFEPRQTIEIGTLNVTCPTVPENLAEVIRAITGVHIVPGTV